MTEKLRPINYCRIKGRVYKTVKGIRVKGDFREFTVELVYKQMYEDHHKDHYFMRKISNLVNRQNKEEIEITSVEIIENLGKENSYEQLF